MRYAYALLLIISIALIAALFMSRGEMDGWYSYEKGLEESKKSKKEIFLFISSPSCPKCREFREFFTKNREAYELISSKYVPVYIPDASKSPVFVESVPKFCIGYEGNFSCFYASSGESLIERVMEWR